MHQLLFVLWLFCLGIGLLLDANVIETHLFDKLPSLKLISSFILVLAACYAFSKTERSRRPVAVLMAFGMSFGFLGDCAMAGHFDMFPSPVIGGMLFFGIGHLAYIFAALLARRHYQLPANSRWWLAILFWQIVGIAVWIFVVNSSEKHLPLHIPALAYGALLAATAGVTTAMALLDRRFVWVALGAMLFLFSDGVIAWEMFQGSTPMLRFLVWATYGPGQMLIVFGFAKILAGLCVRKLRPETGI